MSERGRIDLSIGGPSWAGWRFGSWGKARDWRILGPDGEAFQAPELAALPHQAADLAYLQALARDQAAKLAGVGLSLAPDEAALVRVALGLLLREIPIQAGLRPGDTRPRRLVKLA